MQRKLGKMPQDFQENAWTDGREKTNVNPYVNTWLVDSESPVF